MRPRPGATFSQAQRKELEAERAVLHQMLQNIRDLVSDVVLSFDLQDFRQETDQLLIESRKLHEDQQAYRQKLADISEERRLWLEQRDLVKATLAEMDEAFAAALEQPVDVACPKARPPLRKLNRGSIRGVVQDAEHGLFNALISSARKSWEAICSEDEARKEREEYKQYQRGNYPYSSHPRRPEGLRRAIPMTWSSRKAGMRPGRSSAGASRKSWTKASPRSAARRTPQPKR